MLGSRGTVDSVAARPLCPLERAELILLSPESSVDVRQLESMPLPPPTVVVSVPARDDAPLLLSRLRG